MAQINEPSGGPRCRLRHAQRALIRFNWLLFMCPSCFSQTHLLPGEARDTNAEVTTSTSNHPRNCQYCLVSPDNSRRRKFTVITKRCINLGRSNTFRALAGFKWSVVLRCSAGRFCLESLEWFQPWCGWFTERASIFKSSPPGTTPLLGGFSLSYLGKKRKNKVNEWAFHLTEVLNRGESLTDLEEIELDKGHGCQGF